MLSGITIYGMAGVAYIPFCRFAEIMVVVENI
jgi:hypothetical protein